MKSIVKKSYLLLLPLIMLLFSSCEKEAKSFYTYTIEVESVSGTTTNISAKNELTIIIDYMTILGMFEAEDFDSEAKDTDAAIKKNDEQAYSVFKQRKASYNEVVLKSKLQSAGYTRFEGKFRYVVLRDGSTKVGEEDLSFSY